MNQPPLKHFINLWTLVDYPNGSAQGEWTLDQKLGATKAAGFDGFQGKALPELVDLARKHDLAYLGLCDADAGNYRQRLEGFQPIKPVRINVQLCNHDTPPAEAVDTWIDLLKAATDLGLTVDLEVHRDTCTETPEKTWEIAERFEQKTGEPIRFNFDYSHFAVVKHLRAPYAARLLLRPDLIRLTRQMHLRPFNGHHAQIPVTDGAGQIAAEAAPWLDFVGELFAVWLAGGKQEETLWVCPELGALNSGYWIPPFPDPWTDTIFARGEFEKRWQKAGE